jgi:hypothetical protein
LRKLKPYGVDVDFFPPAAHRPPRDSVIDVLASAGDPVHQWLVSIPSFGKVVRFTPSTAPNTARRRHAYQRSSARSRSREGWNVSLK